MKVTFHKNKLTSLLFLALSLLLVGCFENPFTDYVKEGVITYKIEYPGISEDNVMFDLMPRRMEMSFKDDNYRTDIIAGMGLFKTSIISEADNNQLTHTVKMLNKKFASKLSHQDISQMQPELAGIEIEYTGNKKDIAGFKCKEAKLLKDGETLYTVYYTDKIKIKNPNNATPFEGIPGVLMEYEMVNYDTHMKFTVEGVVKKDINPNDLKLEDGYEMISAAKLENEIQSIFDKVK